MSKSTQTLRWIFALALLFTPVLFPLTSRSSVFASGFNTPILRTSKDIDALAGQWIQTAGPSIWGVQSVTVKDNYIFAGGNGLWRLSASGGIWNPINRGLPASGRITALTAVGGTLFAGTDRDEIFRSPDNGDTWTRVRTGLPQSIFRTVSSFAVIGSNFFVSFSQDGVCRSTDDGA